MFTTAGGNAANNIAKWDGTDWSDVSGGMDSTVLALTVFNNQLFAGGHFSHAGATPVNRVARWNPLGIGVWESFIDNEVSIYPNPFTVSTTLVLNNEVKNGSLKIYNTHGKLERTLAFSGKQILIQKEDLSQGIYFYHIDSAKEIIASGKIIIQ